MSLVMGYTGGTQMDRNFTDNPLRAAVSPSITLNSDEVNAVLDTTNWSDWSTLNTQRKVQVARAVLLARGDPASQRQAEQLGLNVAIYSNIQVVQSPPVQRSAFPALTDFLL